MMRFDVEIATPYIPSSNPFYGAGARSTKSGTSVWQSVRFSFDRQTGDMYIGDVGQYAIEEIDFAPAGASGLQLRLAAAWRACRAPVLSGCSATTPR